MEGDGDVEILRVAGIHDAGPGDITFVANPKYEKLLSASRASAVILKRGAASASCAVLRAGDPYLAFARAVRLFAPDWRPTAGVHAHAAVAADAQLGRDVSVGAFVAIDSRASIGDRTVIFPNVTIGRDARIGSDCIIHSNVSIRERVVIGDRVILQNGVVVGGDGTASFAGAMAPTRRSRRRRRSSSKTTSSWARIRRSSSRRRRNADQGRHQNR